MHLPSLIRPVLPGSALLRLAAGCRSFESGRGRHEQTESFKSNLNPLAEAEQEGPINANGAYWNRKGAALSMGERFETVRRNCLKMVMKMERTLQS